MKCSNEFSSIPTPLEVLSGNATLFVNSIFYREKVLGQVNADNYRSFIAAVAVVTKKHFERTTCPAKKQQRLATDLVQILEAINIKMNTFDTMLLDVCCSKLYSQPGARTVLRSFYTFKNFLEHKK